MTPDVFVRLELNPSAKSKLDKLSDKKGMTQVALLSRMVDWFVKQPEMVQGAVMGHYPPEIESGIAKLILERISAGKKMK